MIWSAVLLAHAMILSSSSTVSFGRDATAELILYNGKIFTSDAANPYVQALAMRGERIVATGGNSLCGNPAKAFHVQILLMLQEAKCCDIEFFLL